MEWEVPALPALVLMLLAQALYATKLNVDFYREHAPFDDSSSYTNELAAIASVARSDGFVAGLKAGLSGTAAVAGDSGPRAIRYRLAFHRRLTPVGLAGRAGAFPCAVFHPLPAY